MYYLPKSVEFGSLDLKATYSFYDVPRVFIAYSVKKKSKFLAYWIDESESYDDWYYVNVNDDEISRLEASVIQLRDIFSYKDTYKVRSYFNPKQSGTVEELNYKEVDPEALPPFGITVKKSDQDKNKYLLIEKNISDFRYDQDHHEIRLFRDRGNKTIEWEPVQKIVGSWSKIYLEVTDSLKLKDPSLVPESSEVGSYKVKFSAHHNDELISNALKIFNLITDNNIAELKKLNIDLQIIEELISHLKEYNVKFEIRSNSGATLKVIDPKEIKDLDERLTEYNLETITSSKVPQADELSRLITLVKKLSNNETFNDESEGITHRQVNYYKTAAFLLGLVKQNGLILTPLGWKVALADSEKQAYLILAECFENSECGWAWLKHTQSKSVYDLDPDTATDFLLTKSLGLSESTAKRRATTLKSWINEFKSFK